MRNKIIVFNFGVSDKAEVLVIENGNIIYAGEFHGTVFSDILKELLDHKDAYCYLPKYAYLKSLNGNSCFDILINSGFRVA